MQPPNECSTTPKAIPAELPHLANLRLDARDLAALSRQGDQELKYDWDAPNEYLLLGLPPDSGTDYRKNEYDSRSGVIKLHINPLKKLRLYINGNISSGDYREFPATSSTSDPFNGERVSLRFGDLSDSETFFTMTSAGAEYEYNHK